MPETIYKTGLIVIVLVVIAAGLCDLGFYLSSMPTISAWLRQNPRWFIVPAGLMLLFLAALALHLFVP